MSLHVIFHAKENIFEKVTKYLFPSKDVILFSFGINLNITYLTKCINSDTLISEMHNVSK